MSSLSPQAASALKARLQALYADGSKHAVYQNVPEFVRGALGYYEMIDEDWRSDTPRYEYLAERLTVRPGETIADVGANTGYFALKLARAHSECHVRAYEPNPNHRAFIREIAEAFALGNLSVNSEVWSAGNLETLQPSNTVLLLNILHHAGFDFDLELSDSNSAFEAYASAYLRRLAKSSRALCFQIGSNRGGDKLRPLFAFDDDLRRLQWSCQLLADSGWLIRHVGVAGRDATGRVHYTDIPENMLASAQANQVGSVEFSGYFAAANLRQFPGEFYRRPLFICEAN